MPTGKNEDLGVKELDRIQRLLCATHTPNNFEASRRERNLVWMNLLQRYR